MTYPVHNRLELVRIKFLEIIAQVLVRQVAADEDAVNRAIRARQLPPMTLRLGSGKVVDQPLQAQSGRRAADQPFLRHLHGQSERIYGGNLFKTGGWFIPWEW